MGSDVTYDQLLLDTIFSDLDHLLDKGGEDGRCDVRNCVLCGRSELVHEGHDSPHPGASVCASCGAVQPGPVIYDFMYAKSFASKSSNYKRIHHWHERISQLLLTESQIPNWDMLLIAEKLCDGTHTTLDKDVIRSVLRPLGMQTYIEKWLQITHRLTGICPPAPGAQLLMELDAKFVEMQRPFNQYAHEKRKYFLNYNYVFCRLFQKLGCHQFCMFFPLIKSKQKLRALDEMWSGMVESIGWEVIPLLHVTPFAVRLQRPSALLALLKHRLDDASLAAPRTEPLRMVFQTLDRHHLDRMIRRQERHRYNLPEPYTPPPKTGPNHRRRSLASVRR